MIDPLRLSILTPEGKAFDEGIRSVVVPAADGMMGVLPDHAPLIAALRAGIVRVDAPSGTVHFVLDQGFMEVRGGREVVILADHVERAENLEDARSIFKQHAITAESD